MPGSLKVTRPAMIAATICVTIGVMALPRASSAGEQNAAQTIDQLRQRIDEIERAMQEQIAALRKQIAEQESAGVAAVPVTPLPDAQTIVSGAAQSETFARDRETVARVDNAPVDPTRQGFIGIPGTPARLKVDGYAKLDTIVDGKPAGNPDQFVPSSIPVGLPSALRTASTTMHVRQTRVNLDFRSPTEFGGDFRTFAEIDFFGPSGALDPRLRHFYGQLANVLVGQTWTTFADVDAFPDTLDFSGPAGISLLRQAQVRYTHPVSAGQSLALAIERPLTQAPLVTDTGAAYSPAPDVIARYRFERARGHVQVGSLVRSLGYRIAGTNTTKLGLGFNASGVWKPVSRDFVIAYVAYGRGIARYIDNLATVSADLDLDDSATDVTPLPALGAYLAYTHQWPNRFRSTWVFGHTDIDNTIAQAPTAYHSSRYFSANLLWNPAGSLNVGVEYLFGTHQLKSGDDAHASRVQFAAKYDFFRKRAVE